MNYQDKGWIIRMDKYKQAVDIVSNIITAGKEWYYDLHGEIPDVIDVILTDTHYIFTICTADGYKDMGYDHFTVTKEAIESVIYE